MIYVRILNNIATGYYTVSRHGQSKCDEVIFNGGISISPQVWSIVRRWYRAKFIGILNADTPYTILDFEEVVKPAEPVSPIEKTDIEKLQDKILLQDELINVNMMATDEIFVMIEPLLQGKQELYSSNRKVVRQPMVDMYVAMIMRGLKKDVSEIPARYRVQVQAILDQLEK